MDNSNNKSSRLDIYCAGGLDAFMAKSSLMKNCIKVTEDQAKSAKNTIDVLISRHNYLSRVEEYIANSSVLLPYYAQAQDEVASAQNCSMVTIFITALEKISNVLSEYENEYISKDKEELVARIQELESKNKELQDTLDQIAKIFGVIDNTKSD